MDQNPYQAPAEVSVVQGVISGTREDLRAVAKYQKGVLVCILIQLIAVLVQFAVPPELSLLVSIGTLVVGVAGTVFVFLLATKVYSTGLGILLGILTLVPCLGLIVLLIVNQKATNVLRQNGVRVGLLGSNPSQI